MSESHRRKKQPVEVRQHLLVVAAQLCFELGLNALTLDAVAKKSSVSKGGLLHHFPSKQALLEALVETCLDDLDHRLAEQMAKDKTPNGRFARAYLAVCANSQNRSDNVRWDNLAALLMSDVSMRSRWSTWATRKLAEHKGTDDKMSSVVVRLAADGLWLSDVAGSPGLSQGKRKQLIAYLIKLTRQTD